MIEHARDLLNRAEEEACDARAADEFDEPVPQLVAEPGHALEDDRPGNNPNFIRVTDDQ